MKAEIIKALKQIISAQHSNNSKFTYMRILKEINNYPGAISSLEDLKKIKYVKEKTFLKIASIVENKTTGPAEINRGPISEHKEVVKSSLNENTKSCYTEIPKSYCHTEIPKSYCHTENRSACANGSEEEKIKGILKKYLNEDASSYEENIEVENDNVKNKNACSGNDYKPMEKDNIVESSNIKNILNKYLKDSDSSSLLILSNNNSLNNNIDYNDYNNCSSAGAKEKVNIEELDTDHIERIKRINTGNGSLDAEKIEKNVL
ncbi:hypothetical protein ENBRE01_0332 [Enteropsectra breve]|nr:hypothetical protein ENBRE01_0332 [Enteropsectra breve]